VRALAGGTPHKADDPSPTTPRTSRSCCDGTDPEHVATETELARRPVGPAFRESPGRVRLARIGEVLKASPELTRDVHR
jgi:hypothetical protein